MLTRRRGFTLIELLVVIAIIGILAAMLFPVFARARESARKIQCLSNVKNIALAMQMYLTDYDRFPPYNTDREVLAWLDSLSSSGNGCSLNGSHRYNGSNPYLRWPVILDEYIKNRDIWLCPSAQRHGYAQWIVPQYTSVWWHYIRDNGFGGPGPGCCGPCVHAWPTGWGGSVTDSVAQEMFAEDESDTFKWSICAASAALVGRSASEIDDPATWVVAGDNQESTETLQQAFGAIYGSGSTDCCWELSTEESILFYTDPTFRKKYAPHLGGANFGFADGHAKWWPGDAMVQEAGDCQCCVNVGPDQTDGWYNAHQGIKGFCPDFEVINVPGA